MLYHADDLCHVLFLSALQALQEILGASLSEDRKVLGDCLHKQAESLSRLARVISHVFFSETMEGMKPMEINRKNTFDRVIRSMGHDPFWSVPPVWVTEGDVQQLRNSISDVMRVSTHCIINSRDRHDLAIDIGNIMERRPFTGIMWLINLFDDEWWSSTDANFRLEMDTFRRLRERWSSKEEEDKGRK